MAEANMKEAQTAPPESPEAASDKQAEDDADLKAPIQDSSPPEPLPESPRVAEQRPTLPS
jgi:hypothetical protein